MQPVKQPTNNAPYLTIPAGQAMSVEHPCIIKNVDKAIDMIGGASAISQALQEDSDRTFALSFHPNDPAARTILANRKEASNVLLRVSVPKRTGRKRKRGSNDPWTDDAVVESSKRDASYLVKSMADNATLYKVTALTGLSSMHIWRSMPDFAYSTSQLNLLQDVKSKLLSQHYPTVKDFNLPRTYGLEDTTSLPPSVWSNTTIPQNYTYRQNPSVKVTSDPSTGKAVLRNSQAAPKIYSYQIQWDTTEVPMAPMTELMPLEEQSTIFQATVTALKDLFHERPIWTRRALLNRLESHLSSFNVVRFCLAYVAYAVRSGPWRDTYVQLGVDPRTDAKYRFYQSVMLQLVAKTNQGALAPGVNGKKAMEKSNDNNNDNSKEADPPDETPDISRASVHNDRDKLLESRHTYARFWSRSNDINSHIFDGVSPLPPDGKVWQLCDIVDPQLAALRDVPDLYIRATCENRYFGWYANGTNAKMRVALKAKVDALMDGKPLDHKALVEFLNLPERVGLEWQDSAIQEQDPEGPGASSAQADTQLLASQDPPLQIKAPVVSVKPTRQEALSVYLGENATKQQLEWAALYRSFARTEPGQRPATGGQGSGRLTKSKPTYRKSYKNKGNTDPAPAQEPSSTTANLQQGVGNLQSAPIDVDMENEEELEHFEGPEVQEGEEVIPSIELNGFDVDEGDDSELGLDIDPEIKIEEFEGIDGLNEGHDQGNIDPRLSRMSPISNSEANNCDLAQEVDQA